MTLQLDPPLFGTSGEKVFNLDAFGLIKVDYCNNNSDQIRLEHTISK
jgi:hypothetical protein